LKKPNLVNNNNDELIIVSNLVNVRPINNELTENLQPQYKLEEEVSGWPGEGVNYELKQYGRVKGRRP